MATCGPPDFGRTNPPRCRYARTHARAPNGTGRACVPTGAADTSCTGKVTSLYSQKKVSLSLVLLRPSNFLYTIVPLFSEGRSFHSALHKHTRGDQPASKIRSSLKPLRAERAAKYSKVLGPPDLAHRCGANSPGALTPGAIHSWLSQRDRIKNRRCVHKTPKKLFF